jgi:hypothetical protein
VNVKPDDGAFVAQAILPVRFFEALEMGRTAKIGCATNKRRMNSMAGN